MPGICVDKRIVARNKSFVNDLLDNIFLFLR
uniref:Uncharacterized protein n=1 Tax=Myoviridae sp. ctzS633 TaxID=2825212 RepID=A0A8S5PT28_9CAUD|nr:MAG TPA: hypothetical protein [Myoviridae sp. ctzS633]